MAQWIRRLPTEQEIPGSSSGMGLFFASSFFDDAISSAKQKKMHSAGCGLSPAP